jgi:hypothetical protein
VDKAKSTVVLTATGIDFDLYLPANKRCIKRVDLYNDIDVEGSDYKILGTKVSCRDSYPFDVDRKLKPYRNSSSRSSST